MKKVQVCATRKNRKPILEFLQRKNIVELIDIKTPDSVFSKMDTEKGRATFRRNVEEVQNARMELDKLVPVKGEGLAFLKGREAISTQDYHDFYDVQEAVLRDAGRINRLAREIVEAKAEIVRAEAALDVLAPWLDLPVAQTFKGTRRTRAFVGSLAGELSLQKIYEKIAQVAPDLDPLHIEIVWQSKQITCILAVALKKDAARAEEALRAIGFAYPAGASANLPEEERQRLLSRKEAAQHSIKAATAEIKSLAHRREEFKMLEDHLAIREEKYAVIERLAQSKHVFVLEGYVPAQRVQALSKGLQEEFPCYVAISEADEPGEEVPVLLENSWLTEPVESVLEGYSLPGKGELDPTGVMSIFYYVMFGLMFSDAGYGAIMFATCLFCLLRFKNMEPNWNKNLRLFMWCGLSTMFWGVVFSSYFGDVVDVFSLNFFGVQKTIPPLWFLPMEKPMLLLVFSLGVGMVHLTTGYIMKGLTCFKQKDYIGILYDAVFPIVAWYPLVLVLIGSDMFEGLAGFKVLVVPIVTQIALGLCVVSIIGIVLTGGRESANWFKRILKGVYALYSVLSGWLGDVLSYSRLLALGLATGVIASVMNQLGAMTGGGVAGVIVFIIVFALGQSLNFGINVLGAYVHSNRLEYVEFFGKFYNGGGRKFSPFGINTKHYKIREDL